MSDLSPTRDRSSLRLATELGADRLLLDAIEGEEHLSAPFCYRLRMTAAAADVDAAALLGTSACIALEGDEGDCRRIHGSVTWVGQEGRRCEAELRPKLWELTLASDCRVFQAKTVPEIVKLVLQEQGVTDLADRLTGTYAALDYCVQYRETCFDFVSRLLEDAGIAYFFEHGESAHTLVLADDVGGHPACEGASSVPFAPLAVGRGWLVPRGIDAARHELSVTSDGVQLDDYAFVTPGTELKVSAGGSTRLNYQYPGRYNTRDTGTALASRRLAELEAEATRLRGEGAVRAFLAGTRFTLTDHPQAALNQAWLLRSVWLQAAAGAFRCEFVAIPEATPFRPPRRAPRPQIGGSQTAVVVGAAGEEIWTDAHGRIKVQFHWDQRGTKDENSSCWVRVAQSWAGQGWGAFTLPRIGQEVVVSFLDGDPDRPLVTGCVYNGANAPPYALPDEQTRTTLKSNSSPGGNGCNELRFEDKAGAEEIWLNAQRDLTIAVGNARSVTVTEADDKLEVQKGNRSVAVAKGDESLTVAGTRTVKVTGAETHTSEADHTLKVGGKLTIEVTGDILIKASGALALEAATSVSLKAGTSVAIQAGTSLALEGGTTMALKGAASGSVEAGALLEIKGALVKIN